jgi:MinD-like ATPase involved in chromosome partitioning or flagellar assembly
VSGDRYALLGLAPARAEWFRAVAHWCNAASVPASFEKCVSPEQVRAQLAGGRAFSAVLLDVAAPGFDRDLLDAAARAQVPVLAVDDGRGGPGLVDLADLAVAALLPHGFGPDHLLDVLAAHARPVEPVDAAVLDPVNEDDDVGATGQGRVLAVCGPGGTGASTVAIALAQVLRGRVLLADLKLNAEQAMLHDSRDVVPGVQELVEAHRARRPSRAEVQSMTYRVAERGYDLLLGLRRASAWTALRPRAVAAALDSLQAAWSWVVCDVDPDLDGDRETGSADMEDRNALSRAAVARADAVLVVGSTGMKGVHSMLRVVSALAAFGVEGERIVPVVNRARRGRGETASALRALGQVPTAPNVFLPERRVDDLLRHGGRLPPVLTSPLATAIDAIDVRPVAPAGHTEPELIAPGSLGSWSEG